MKNKRIFYEGHVLLQVGGIHKKVDSEAEGNYQKSNFKSVECCFRLYLMDEKEFRYIRQCK